LKKHSLKGNVRGKGDKTYDSPTRFDVNGGGFSSPKRGGGRVEWGKWANWLKNELPGNSIQKRA